MRLLLDTHALLWWLVEHPSLTARAKGAIADTRNTVHVSAAVAWEIATKYRLGKLPGAAFFVDDIPAQLAAEGFHELPVSVRHGQLAGALQGTHKDPFDRVLIAQALIEDMALVSNESRFDTYGVNRLW